MYEGRCAPSDYKHEAPVEDNVEQTSIGVKAINGLCLRVWIGGGGEGKEVETTKDWMLFQDLWAKQGWDTTSHRAGLDDLVSVLPDFLAISSTDEAFIPANVRRVFHLRHIGLQTLMSVGNWTHVAKDPDALWNLLRAEVDKLPPLQTTLQQLLGDVATLRQPVIASLVLRDWGLPFEELSKLPTAKIRETLQASGLGDDDANTVALGIYTQRRRQISNEVPMQTPTEVAISGLTARDEHVSFSSCQLVDSSLDALGAMIAPCAGSLLSLDFSSNAIQTAGAKKLADVVLSLGSLQALNFAGNHILGAGCLHVLQAVSAPKPRQHIRSLNLSGCRGGSKLMQYIRENIGGLPSLTFLGLAGNDLFEISEFPDLPSLRTLDLSSNGISSIPSSSAPSAHGAGGGFVSLVLKQLPVLNSLMLSNNTIDDKAVATLCRELAEHTAEVRLLRSIDLSHNPFGNDGTVLQSLLSLIRGGGHGLLRFALQGTRAGNAASKQIQESIAAADKKTSERVHELRRVPFDKWTAEDIAIVTERIVVCPLSSAKLLSGVKSGKDLSLGETLVNFNAADWRAWKQFQSA